jgi:serine/alanine adding enzyme
MNNASQNALGPVHHDDEPVHIRALNFSPIASDRHVPSEAQPWNDYVQRSPDASLYHLYGWREVVHQTFGHPTFYLSASTDSSGIVGVLPLVQLKSRLFGHMLVSLPYFNYGGICAGSSEVRAGLLRSAIQLASDQKAEFLEIRHEDDWNQELPKKTTKVSMRLDLPASPEDLWKSFPAKLRNQVQRPRKEGMIASVGQEDELEAFYDVFSENMRDLGTPVYPKVFFRNILRKFPERTWIATIRLNGQPVASGFLAGFKDRLEIPWASSLKAFNRLSPNMLLYWTSLEFACRKGYSVFDFGRSTRDEGTYRFKAQWGARPHPLYWYYWLRNGGDIPQINPTSQKYRMAIAAWRRLPLGVSRFLGPKIIKYIPS